ncbi:N-acylneuraminate-9-phosphatase [Contarinia nasturtii]|uniref:N-acylneuraminate-9-phosphatase n=1 Tax=Contarinia nasturtii TaxID=265458 RepID=UPI0012D4683B|nr:N-acylneuraminate-9-phosphatase [Contarinia nasturtii]
MHEHFSTKYNVPNDVADEITSTYLHNFRRCPDNIDLSLDVWRQHLWCQALSQHKYNSLTSAIYEKWLELRYKYLELKPETLALLQSLRSCYRLAILTNGPSNAQWEKINRLHLTKYFDCILVSGDLPWEKPDPNIFYAACNHLGVAPSECVMVGDKLETDIQGANVARLGCSIWMPLNGDTANANTQIKPDFTIFDLKDLLNILPISEYCHSDNSTIKTKTMMKNAMMRRNSGPSATMKTTTTSMIKRLHQPISLADLDLDNGNSNSSDGS